MPVPSFVLAADSGVRGSEFSAKALSGEADSDSGVSDQPSMETLLESAAHLAAPLREYAEKSEKMMPILVRALGATGMTVEINGQIMSREMALILRDTMVAAPRAWARVRDSQTRLQTWSRQMEVFDGLCLAIGEAIANGGETSSSELIGNWLNALESSRTMTAALESQQESAQTGLKASETSADAASAIIDNLTSKGESFLQARESQEFHGACADYALRESQITAELAEKLNFHVTEMGKLAKSLEAAPWFQEALVNREAVKKAALEERYLKERKASDREAQKLEKERESASRELISAETRLDTGKTLASDESIEGMKLLSARERLLVAELKEQLMALGDELKVSNLDLQEDRLSVAKFTRALQDGMSRDSLNGARREAERKLADLDRAMVQSAKRNSGFGNDLSRTRKLFEEHSLKAEQLKKSSNTLRREYERLMTRTREHLDLEMKRIALSHEIMAVMDQRREELRGFIDRNIVSNLWGNTSTQFFRFVLILGGTLIAAFIFRTLNHFIVSRILRKTPFDLDEFGAQRLKGPFTLAILTAGVWAAFRALYLSMGAQGRVEAFFHAMLIVNLAFFILAIIDIVSRFFEKITARTETRLDDQLLPIVRKSLKVIVVTLAFSTILENAGYRVTSLVTGLGLGGLAFALAAKDTLSNFFGSMMIFTDKPFEVGDWVIFNGIEGIIEDIGIRSTKVRTWADTMITVPNSIVASAAVENVSRFRSRRISTTLRLRLDTPPEKVERAVEIFREILDNYDEVDPGHYVFYTDIGDYAHEIMVYFFSSSTEWRKYLNVRQEVFLRLRKQFQIEGIHLAMPSEMRFSPEQTIC
jgi:MscS family membrane protein